MKNIKSSVVIFLAILGITGLINGQGNMPWPERCPEHVSFFSDRNLYVAGESVWFTASCFLDEEAVPSLLSRILYVELYNAGQKVFIKTKFSLQEGRVSGRLIIPEELPSAHYFIRAYTQLMRNYPPEVYHHSAIIVLNPEFPPILPDTIKAPEIYTEGEFLIPGIENRIAIRFHHRESDRIRFIGIFDSTGAQNTELSRFDSGIATGSFIPADSNDYFIQMINFKGDTTQYQLPPVKDDLPGMKATLTEQNLNIRFVGNTEKWSSSQLLKLNIWTQEKFRAASYDISVTQLESGLLVPRSILPAGINFISLETPENELLDLTTVYLPGPPAINIEVQCNASQFGRREPVELKLETNNLQNDGIELMQVAVVKNGTKINSGELPLILLTNPLLWRDAAMDLSDPDIREQLQGGLLIYNSSIKKRWKEWRNLPNQSSEFIPDIRDISITGIVKDRTTGQPLPDLRVYTTVLHEDFQLHSTKTSATGRFIFSYPHLAGEHDLFLRTERDTTIQPEILLNNDFSTDFSELQDVPLLLDSADRQLMDELLVNQQVSATFALRDNARIDSVPPLQSWFGTQMKTILLADYIALGSVREIFSEIVPYVRLRERDGQYQIIVFDDISQVYYEDPLLLLDGIPIMDAGILMELYPAQIEKIEVMNKTYMLGGFSIRGMVSVRTKTQNFGGVNLPEDVIFLNYSMRNEPAEFIPPDSTFINSLGTSRPWFKTLLLYTSKLPENGTITLPRFYTSDQTGDYKVIISGKTTGGRPIQGTTSMKVVNTKN